MVFESFFALFLFTSTVVRQSESSNSGSLLGSECARDGNVCKLPDNEHSLRFFILGDWGGQQHHPYTTDIQEMTAANIYNASLRLRPNFFVSTGDNFYEKGVQSVDDKKFKLVFDNVYLYGKVERIPWYISAGNHDYYGNIQAQMDYSKVNPRWTYPSLYYPVHYSMAGQGAHARRTTVAMFMLDTIVLCGRTTLGGWDGNANKYIMPSDRLNGPDDVVQANKSKKWLEDKLTAAKEDFVFVVGHYPVYSVGTHGDTECLRTWLPDMLIKYKVNAYISGHEHQLQHSTSEGSNGWVLNHIISGGGSKPNKHGSGKNTVLIHGGETSTNGAAQGAAVNINRFSYPTKHDSEPLQGGYVYAEVWRSLATFDFYQSDGTFKYSFTSQTRNPV